MEQRLGPVIRVRSFVRVEEWFVRVRNLVLGEVAEGNNYVRRKKG